MLLISRHLTDYWHFPAGVFTVRVNLAWEEEFADVRQHLAALPDNQGVFLDVPLMRIKPPCRDWSLIEIIELVNEFACIRYIGISLVERAEDLMAYVVKLPNVTVVPKIESVMGCQRIADIAYVLPEPKIVMLDHDDLFHDMLANGLEPASLYDEHITPMIEYCQRNDIRLLRTAGVMFADHQPLIRPEPRLVIAELCSHTADALASLGENESVSDLACDLRHKANTLRIVQTKTTEDT